ncbi:MAG: metallophosphoesterase [Oligoflexia bacterium]|nr:metallophosphoesterase [Oligoflexia bacterium]
MRPSFVVFFSIVSTILLLALVYCWRRLVEPLMLSRPWKNAALATFVLLFAIQVIGPFWYRQFSVKNPEGPYYFGWLTYLSLGFIAMIFFSTLVKDLIILISEFSLKTNPERRLFLEKALSLGALGAATGGWAVGVGQAVYGPVVREVPVPVSGLPEELNGVTIAQVSDLHVGPTIRRKEVERVAEIVNGLHADFVAITGDLVDGTVEQLRADVEPLGKIKAKIAKFYCSGNHEYYWGLDQWVAHLESLGYQAMENRGALFPFGTATLGISGVRDFACQRIREDHVSDPREAMRGCESANFKILLAHQPKSCIGAFEAGFDLQVSGHTHHGQFMPFHFFAGLAHPYYKGLNLHKDKMWVYVNAGTGYWGPPLRLGIPSEISLIRLVRA